MNLEVHLPHLFSSRNNGEAQRQTETYREGLRLAETGAWRARMGKEIEMGALPDFVDRAFTEKIKGLGFEHLIYVPRLEIGDHKSLRSGGVNDFPAQMQARYPGWRDMEQLTYPQRFDPNINRNMSVWYWRHVAEGDTDFPENKGVWMAVESLDKPEGTNDNLAEILGLARERNVTNGTKKKIRERVVHEKPREIIGAFALKQDLLLRQLGLDSSRATIRLPAPLELNLIHNRLETAETDIYEITRARMSNLSVMPETQRAIMVSRNNVGVWPENEKLPSFARWRAVVELKSN